jgi:8-hydroxy-5-deazaflavin:NADPH oxidoreductase
VLLAVWLDTTMALIAQNKDLLHRKVIVDPSNPIQLDGKGGFSRTLPDGQSAASVIAGLLPADAPLVKAFGTLGAEALATSANRKPRRAALFYATNDEGAAATVERLITTAGFDPVKAGGLDDATRIEVAGDLHQRPWSGPAWPHPSGILRSSDRRARKGSPIDPSKAT